ncbi:lysosomal thioesterase ppt2 [Anaeramoeba ignava]|uniref:Lysosomal thioesterase ppt2 n=1 Tax=Anaeramoeba ignava TaxID=1746090 RepID=A0A9Q0RDF5_ANAIG|nr:lysosomal thioesterase ppt2 [Anaeramoeba ignava]
MITKFLIVLIFSSFVLADWPIVVMHGCRESAEKMAEFVGWIKAAKPDVYVLNMEIGDGLIDSLIGEMSKEVDEFNANIQADPVLSKSEKINVVGFSQGGLLCRGYIERYNSPPVANFITLATPHAGVFGIPVIDLQWLDELLKKSAYIPGVQEVFTFAQYWKDPLDYNTYLEKSIFLPDLNNEKETKNPKYRENLISLDSFTMLMATADIIVYPNESELFGFYDENLNVIPYNNTQAYKEDWLGIKTLQEEKKLYTYSVPCTHGTLRDGTCGEHAFKSYVLPHLQ